METENNSNTPLKENVETNRIREQSTEIITDGHVFYNPVQEFNRDLSILVLNLYFKLLRKERKEDRKRKKFNDEEDATNQNAECISNEYVAGQKYDDGMRILEALSATGLRSIRYAKEIAGVREIIANDLSKQAVDSIKANVEHNKVNHLVEVSHSDAMTLMYLSTSGKKRFDVIDLDPYGCPNRFLDGAVQSIADGGLLLVTATDMAVLAGNAPEACYSKYGTVPLRMKCCHEMALRILLHCVETHANRYGKYVEPLLSISADFYIRIFLRVHCSQAQCKLSMSKMSMVYQCTGCDIFTLQPLGIIKPNPTAKNPNQLKYGIPTGPPVGQTCEHCHHKHHVGGPIWSHSIHNQEFVSALLDHIEKEPFSNLNTQRRILGILNVVSEELNDVPLYYSLDKVCSVLKLQVIPMLKFRSAILYAGYRVSYSHACKNSIKTDVPPRIMWDILHFWSEKHPIKEEHLINNPIIKNILSKPIEGEYNFNDLHQLANPYSRRNALSRYQANPAPHWGPGMRATIMIGDKMSKSVRNQNKKQNRKNPSATEESPERRRKCKQAKLTSTTE